jgi:signal transduction histidine kinase
MFSSLRFRLWLSYVLIVGVVLTIAGVTVTIFVITTPVYERQEIQRLRLASNLIVRRGQLFDSSNFTDPVRLKELATRADELAEARIAIFSPAGELLVDSRLASGPALPDWDFFASRRPLALPVFRDATGNQWVYALTKLENGNTLMAAVPRARAPVFSILRDDFFGPFFRGALLALILTVLLSIWIASWIAGPLQRLEKATRQNSIESVQPVSLEGPREVQAVAQSFNEMAARVAASQRSQKDFIANVSHDLKTPLTSIQGFAQAILDGTADDPKSARQAAQVIYDEAGRMHRMVLELLDLARLEARTFSFESTPVDLGILLHKVVERFSPQARSDNVELRLDFATQADGLPAVIADHDRLSQVFSNLIDNALKYSPAGGKVTVAARPVEGGVEVQISDTGPGIPPSELERIFERFYQTDKARSGGAQRGLGLGLAIAREIVEAHGGTISAYNRSRVNVSAQNDASEFGGSVFVVRLPAARLKEDIETTAVRRKEISTRKG